MSLEALRGTRIIDFTWVLAGPMATKMLAMMGAEVIKIETSLRPEFTRRGGHYPIVNNSKKSIAVNITTAGGQDLIRRLAKISDVVIENFADGVLRKYGLAYEHLRQLRPDLLFVSGSGVGRSGPDKDTLAYGTLLQAYSGRMSMIGPINPRLQRVGLTGWTDPVTAMWETVIILAALRHRKRTGEGGYFDVSMLEGTVALLPDALLREALGQPSDVHDGNWERDASPAGVFHANGFDQWISVSVRTDAQWRGLCGLIERPDLLDRVEFNDVPGRLAAKDGLNAILAAWVKDQDATDAEAALLAAGVPAARARHTGEVVVDPHLAARDVFKTMPDGSLTNGLPWRDTSGWRGVVERAPDLGQDSDYVFRKVLGLGRTEIDALIESGAIC
ncbi:MAG TPA: CoA transferase [Devosia sp.]|nr:CoA transferase [Devosia sp.]